MKKKAILITHNRFGCFCLRKLIDLDLIDIIRVFTLKKELTANVSDYEDAEPICLKNKIGLEFVKNINDHAEEIKKIKPDIIFVFGWSQFLKEDLIKIPPLGCIGFHPSLLPKNRGRAAIPWHFINEEKYGGATFFYIDKGCDSGDIICQEKFPISQEDNAKTYYEKILNSASSLLQKNTDKIVKNEVRRVKQDENQATYLLIRREEDSFLDFNSMKTGQIFNLIRAVAHVYPTAFAFYDGNKIFIYASEIVPEKLHVFSATPGQIIRVMGNSIWVKTTDGIVELKEIFDSNNQKINYKKYFKEGYHFGKI